VQILGIDPGSRNCGYAIVEKEGRNLRLVEAGLIKIREKELQHQIVELVEGLDLILRSNPVDEVAIEDIFFAFNPKTVLKRSWSNGS